MIQVVELNSPIDGVEELISELDQYLISLYPSESNHLVPLTELFNEYAVFMVATLNGELAGCGSAVWNNTDYAEIKRMFVRSEFRGQGIAKKLLLGIESCLEEKGIMHYCLETGVEQKEAIGLYESCGYFERDPFGSYILDPLSRFYEKTAYV